MLCLNNLGLIHIPCDILYTQWNQFVTDFERQRCNTGIMLLQVHDTILHNNINNQMKIKLLKEKKN